MENRYPVLRCALLRPRGEWPHRHAARQRRELAPPHLTVPLGPRLVQWLRVALCNRRRVGNGTQSGFNIYQVRCCSWVTSEGGSTTPRQSLRWRLQRRFAAIASADEVIE